MRVNPFILWLAWYRSGIPAGSMSGYSKYVFCKANCIRIPEKSGSSWDWSTCTSCSMRWNDVFTTLYSGKHAISKYKTGEGVYVLIHDAKWPYVYTDTAFNDLFLGDFGCADFTTGCRRTYWYYVNSICDFFPKKEVSRPNKRINYVYWNMRGANNPSDFN